MHDYQVCRPGICSSCIVRPSAIRSLVLPDRVFPQNSSSSAHTSSHTKTSHQVQELTLLSINLICGLHKEREMRYASTLLSLFASFVTWKRPELQGRVVTEITWQRYLWGRTSVSGWIFRSVTAPSWAHHLQTRGQDRFHISHNAPGDRHQNILLFFFPAAFDDLKTNNSF